jgi:hypothetical protein
MFKKTQQSKQSPDWRKFAQSGHPVEGAGVANGLSLLASAGKFQGDQIGRIVPS